MSRQSSSPARRRRLLLGVVLATLALSSGCSREPDSAAQLTIFAASSLTEAFSELGTAFRAEHPEIDVEFQFAGSQTLRVQLENGAEADLYASANPVHVDQLVAKGLAREPAVFATNEVVLALRPGLSGVATLDDLPKVERLVLGTDAVPIGHYAEAILKAAGAALGDDWQRAVRERVVSREVNVRLVRAKVLMGEADAAFVYRTDVVPGLQVVALPPKLAARARYSMATVQTGPLAATWGAFLLSDKGQAILQRHGFGAP